MEDLNTQVVEQLNSYALECKKAHKYPTALTAIVKALAMKPEAGILHNNHGAILWNLNRYEDAEAAFLQATALGYENETSLTNMGLLYSSMQEFDKAEEMFARAGELNPENKQAAWQWALTLLDRGDWADGLKAYDVRRQVKKDITALNYPLWDGEDLSGKTIFIQSEQGLGDRILFTRYLHWIKTVWPTSKIKFLCDPKLHNLFWTMKEELDIELIPNQVPWPKADYGQYLMNLPHIFGTTIKNVYPDPGLILKRTKQAKCNIPKPILGNPLKVGICWTGNKDMDQNVQRSIPFPLMMDLASNPELFLYSFQVGSDDIEKYNAGGLINDLGPHLEKEGMHGTAAALREMDVVVTCCTSIAHLAGALNIPTFVVLCYAPYWVWLRGRSDSVWYPSVELVRQEVPGEWSNPMATVKEKLAELAKHK